MPLSDTDLANEFTKGLAPALVGYRRKGRTWARTQSGIITGINVYRLRFSYGIFCLLRLEPFARLEENGSVGPNPPWWHPEWLITDGGAEANSDELRLNETSDST